MSQNDIILLLDLSDKCSHRARLRDSISFLVLLDLLHKFPLLSKKLATHMHVHKRFVVPKPFIFSMSAVFHSACAYSL